MMTMTLTEAARSGRRDTLESMRDLLAEEIENGVPARELASLTRRLLEVIDALDEMEDVREESAADELKRRREERRRRAANSSDRESATG